MTQGQATKIRAIIKPSFPPYKLYTKYILLIYDYKYINS